MPVARDCRRAASPELIVEHFQRQWASVSGGTHRTHEFHNRKVTLTRHVAEMA